MSPTTFCKAVHMALLLRGNVVYRFTCGMFYNGCPVHIHLPPLPWGVVGGEWIMWSVASGYYVWCVVTLQLHGPGTSWSVGEEHSGWGSWGKTCYCVSDNRCV